MSKKFYSFLFLLASFLGIGTGKMRGDDLTVADGTSYNRYLPLYGYCGDYFQKTQMIYPASMLEDMAGGKIKSMTFYLHTPATEAWTFTAEVGLANVGSAVLTSSAWNATTVTALYTGSLDGTGTTMTITFAGDGFAYNGENLLFELRTPTNGTNYPDAYFYGVTGYTTLYGYNSSSLASINRNSQNFLPKTTFNYEPGVITCPKPTDLEYSNVTATSVDLSWTAGGTEPAWNVLYKADGDADWSAVNGVTANSYTLALSPAKNYQVKVQAACGGEDVSKFSNVVSFPTPCGAYPLPFSEDFSAALNSCWTLRNTVSGTGVVSGEFKFYYTKNPSEYLITPEIAVTGNPVKVEFDYRKGYSGTEEFYVGYSTTTNETASFTWSDKVTVTNTSALTYSETLPANIKYVAIQYSADDQYNLFIDNFSLVEDVLPACPKPTALAKSAQTNNSATLSWTKNGSETSWNVQYSTTSDFSDDNHVAVANTNTSYVLGGLTANTHYYVHVQAACEGDYSNVIDFTTDCDPISSVSTWTDGGFEDETENAVPSCWIAKTTDESNQYKPAMYVNTSASYVRTGSKSLLMKAYNDSGEGYAIFPAISDASLTSLQLKFWQKKETAAFILKVGYLTNINDLSAFVELHTCANATVWTEETVDLSTLPSGARLAFYYFGTSGTSKYAVAVDDISFATPPTCFKPLNLSAAAGITPEGATFTWEASGHGETTYQWAVAAGSDAPAWVDDDAHKTSELTKAVSGLAAGTYDFYVRSWCSDSEQSDALKKSFTTATVPAPTIGTITATNNSANASWTAPTGISYSVQYQWSINGTDWSEPTSELSAAISPLEQNTSYTFYVRSYYAGNGTVSANATKTFKTACDPITVAVGTPFEQNFDAVTTNAIPDCWNNDEGTTTTASYKWKVVTGGQSGKCAMFNGTDNGLGKTNVFATPLIELNSDADLSFYWKNKKTGAYTVEISVDGAARTPLISSGLTGKDAWTLKEQPLSAYNGHTIQLFFCGTSANDGSANLYLDEFKITPITCRKPASDPVESGVTGTEATLTWTAGGTNTDYQFALALKDEAPVWEDANVVTALTKSFDDLTPLTWYDFYVRTYCDELNQSEARKVTFQTECASFVTLPFSENFNSLAANAIPECWANSEGTSTDYYKWKGYTYGGTHGTNCVRFNSSTNDADATNVLATPTIQLGEGNLLTFWAKNPTGGDFKVQIKEEGEAAVDLLTEGLTGLDDWTLKYIAIPAGYDNKKVQILFHATSNYNDENAYIYIDDVRVARGEVFADTGNNQSRFTTLKTAGETIDVIFNRTLLCNGDYNTFCLPFSLSAAQIAESPIANFKLKAFDYAAIENEELLIAITNASSIEAGVPYFIANQSNEANQTVQLYQDVVITADAPSNKANSDVTFQGVFNPVDLAAQAESDAHTQLFLAAGNLIYWPAQSKTVKGFRAYFKVTVGGGALHIKAGMPARIVEHTDSATGIENTDADTQALKLLENGNVVIIRNGVKYTIQGQKIQ